MALEHRSKKLGALGTDEAAGDFGFAIASNEEDHVILCGPFFRGHAVFRSRTVEPGWGIGDGVIGRHVEQILSARAADIAIRSDRTLIVYPRNAGR